MLRTVGDFFDEVPVRLGISTTTSGYFTDQQIKDWVKQSYRFVTAYKKWPFTEGRVSTTYASSTEEWDFEGYRADTFRLLQIGGKRYDKRNFSDYQSYREDNSSGSDKIYSDFGRLVFINPQSSGSGTLTAWGQFVPAELDTSDNTITTVFTDREEELHEAMLQLIISYAEIRRENTEKSEYHYNKAVQIIENTWERVKEEQAQYQTHRRGIFKRFDAVEGVVRDEIIKRDQFY